jgi:hypothetical protein
VTGGFDIEGALVTALARLPSCQAAALVDIAAGQLLGLKMPEAQSLAQPELAGPVMAELFNGVAASCIATMWRDLRPGAPAAAGFRDIIIQAPDLLQLYMRLPNLSDYAVMFVWTEPPSLGIALSKANAAIADIEAAFA